MGKCDCFPAPPRPSHSARPRSMAGARPPDINAEATRIKRFMSASIPPVRMPTGSNAVTMGWRQRSTSASVAPDWGSECIQGGRTNGRQYAGDLGAVIYGELWQIPKRPGGHLPCGRTAEYAAFLPSRMVCRGRSKAGSNSGEKTAAGVAPAGGVESTDADPHSPVLLDRRTNHRKQNKCVKIPRLVQTAGK